MGKLRPWGLSFLEVPEKDHIETLLKVRLQEQDNGLCPCCFDRTLRTTHGFGIGVLPAPEAPQAGELAPVEHGLGIPFHKPLSNTKTPV